MRKISVEWGQNIVQLFRIGFLTCSESIIDGQRQKKWAKE